jgi:hypothetical protein
MAVSFNNLVNDSGGNTDGTLIDKAQFQLLLMGAVVASTSTGAQNNWAPGLDGHTLIEWAGASDAAFTGLATGTAGQIATIRNTGTKIGTFAHLSGSSSAANQFTNSATSGVTPIAPGGWITYRHDGTNWKVIDHEQGAWITPTFAAGSYTATAGTWTLAAGDVIFNAYRLSGRTLQWHARLATTSVSNAGVVLQAAIPGGFTAGQSSLPVTRINDNAAGFVLSYMLVNAATAFVQFVATPAGAGFAVAVNTTEIDLAIALEVT